MDRYLINAPIINEKYYFIYKALDTKTNSLVCITKVDRKTQRGAELYTHYIDQAEGLNSSTFSLIDHFKKGDFYFLVTEHFDSNLAEEIKLGSITRLDIEDIMFNLLLSLKSIHDTKRIHGNIYPTTCLKGNNAYRLAFYKDEKLFKFDSEFAIFQYQAPEVLTKQDDSYFANDIWALGCIMAELYLGKPLFSGTDKHSLLAKMVYLKGTPTVQEWTGAEALNKMLREETKFVSKLAIVLKEVPSVARNMIIPMLNWDPLKRPTSGICLQNSYFESKKKIYGTSYFVKKRNMSLTPKGKFTLPTLERMSKAPRSKGSMTPMGLSQRAKINFGPLAKKSKFAKFYTINSKLGAQITKVKANIQKIIDSQKNTFKERKLIKKFSGQRLFSQKTVIQSESSDESSSSSESAVELDALPILNTK